MRGFPLLLCTGTNPVVKTSLGRGKSAAGEALAGAACPSVAHANIVDPGVECRGGCCVSQDFTSQDCISWQFHMLVSHIPAWFVMVSQDSITLLCVPASPVSVSWSQHRVSQHCHAGEM